MATQRESTERDVGAAAVESSGPSLEAFLLDASATARVLDDDAARRAADKSRQAAAANPRLADAIDALKREADTLPPPPSPRKRRPLRPPPESERREYQAGQVPAPTRRDTLELQGSVEVSPAVDPRRRPTQPRVTPPDPPRRGSAAPELVVGPTGAELAPESASPASMTKAPGPSAQTATRGIVLGVLAAVAVATLVLRASPPPAPVARALHADLSGWRSGGARAVALTRAALTPSEPAAAAAPAAEPARGAGPRDARAATKTNAAPEKPIAEATPPGASSDLLYQRKEP